MTTEALLDATAPCAQHFTWQEAWTLAVLHPSVATFETLVADPAASRRRAFKWVLAGLVAGAVLGGTVESDLQLGGLASAACLAATALLLAPLAFLVAFIQAAIPNWIARMSGGRGELDNLLYAFSAFTVPLTMLLAGVAAASTALEAAIPALGGILPVITSVGFAAAGSLAAVYEIALAVIAVRAVHGIGWGGAVLALAPAAAAAALTLAFNALLSMEEVLGLIAM